MNERGVQNYLERAGMETSQAEALAHILSDMATKSDLAQLEHKIDAKLSAMKADLTWRMIALFAFFGTIMTVLDAFID